MTKIKMTKMKHGHGYPVVVSPPPAPSETSNQRLFKVIRGLAACQIALALLCLVWVVAVVMLANHALLGNIRLIIVGSCGAFFTLTGSIGIAGSKRKSRCMMVAFMVLCIISALLVSLVLVVYSFALAYGYEDDVVTSTYGLALVCCLAQLVIAVVASAFSCKVVCCCGEHPGMHIAYMMPLGKGGYPTQLFTATDELNTEYNQEKDKSILSDMYPIHIPIEQADVTPPQSPQLLPKFA